MPPQPINLHEKLNLFSEQWSPKVIAAFEGYEFKLAKAEGDFVWHSHPETDEMFLILSGEMRIDFRDGSVVLREGEMMIVPKGVEHKPFTESECHVMTLSRAGEVNTGDAAPSDKTADPSTWI